MDDEVSCEVPDYNQHFGEGRVIIWHQQGQPWIIRERGRASD